MTLPSGTVTFLFTDIEGSTKLWEDNPEAMRSALARHDALLRQAIQDNNGYVFKTVGDAFCAAFSTATDAVNTALAIHLLLQNQEWKETGPLRVRIGLHTGEAEERDGDYFGQTLNRVARLQSTGYGQQTLLSQTTYVLARDSLLPPLKLHELGTHRLKDLQRPEQVFQLNHPALPAEFPPLKSLDNPELPNNLPQQVTSFIGREMEVESIKSLLDKTRLLTLTGSGGIGKTRLSLQVAADVLENYPGGAWFVELAPLSDPALVPQAVAQALNVTEESGKPLVQTLIAALKGRHLLIVLDNCEHVLDACARLTDTLLRASPTLKVLASSREGLGIAGETLYRIPSLSLPNLHEAATPASVNQYEAVRLFVERALAALPAFTVTNANAPALASVCHRLDGIPLAIELAAARVRSLSLEEINSKLDNRFRLLTGGSRAALPRQQTLRALIDWSYDLLNAQEKVLLRRLSVFAGGWTLSAAEQVSSGEGVTGEGIEDWEVFDLLTSLADKSLVVAQTQDVGTRYRLLETVRQYARDLLRESGEDREVRRQHGDCFLMLAEAASPKLKGADQAKWLGVLEEEHDNLRQALTWYEEDAENDIGAGEKGLRLGADLQQFWWTRGHLSEGRERLSALLRHPGGQKHTKARADALNGAGSLTWMQGDYAQARVLYEESLSIRRELGDKSDIAYSLLNLGNVTASQGDNPQARILHMESLAQFRELGSRAGIALALNNLAAVEIDEGAYAQAHVLIQESLAIRRGFGDKAGIAYSLNNLGYLATKLGDYTQARLLIDESLAQFRELESKAGIAMALNNLAGVEIDEGAYAQARVLIRESLAIHREMGDTKSVAACLHSLAAVETNEGAYAQARVLIEESLAIRRELGDKTGIAYSLNNLGNIAAKLGDYTQARLLIDESLAQFRELQSKAGIAMALSNLGNAASEEGDYGRAHALLKESLAIRRGLGGAKDIASSLEAFALLAVKEAKEKRAASLWGAATTLRKATGSDVQRKDREQEYKITAARDTLGEVVFEAAWAHGQTMTMEQAIEYALSDIDVTSP